ncbi:MAG TPA: acetyl-CoA carboxylase, carboxyltransferase subunit beta [Bacteroidia bacterium]|nr:acetyl-CoA carboxylase, carboxyltransferase subunit beta [Bacteroidia bacterium]
MGWFKRLKEGITTSTKEKKETPEGLWYKCTKCKKIATMQEHEANSHVCVNCGHHERISSEQYFEIIFDGGAYTELQEGLIGGDPLNFVDTKPYKDRITESRKKTGLNDAMRAAFGKVHDNDLVVCCMDFNFIGGSMGSVVGEKISRSIDFCLKTRTPLLIISKSGGARMMEAAFSLMQMAKTSAKLSLMAKEKLAYISLLTDPTTGGVTASFAMLGDINVGEPQSLIGFAGPRIVKETIGKDLPKGFQTAEFVLEHGFLDKIVVRTELKTFLANFLTALKN